MIALSQFGPLWVYVLVRHAVVLKEKPERIETSMILSIHPIGGGGYQNVQGGT